MPAAHSTIKNAAVASSDFFPADIPVTFSGAGETVRVSQSPVEVNGLSIVGVAPVLGRTYTLADFADVVKEKEVRAIVISYDTWQRYFKGAPDVIGRTIRVDAEPRIGSGGDALARHGRSGPVANARLCRTGAAVVDLSSTGAVRCVAAVAIASDMKIQMDLLSSSDRDIAPIASTPS